MPYTFPWWLYKSVAILMLAGACGPATSSAPPTTAEAKLTASPLAATAQSVQDLPRPAPPVFGAFDPASVRAIQLSDYPIVPVIDPKVRLIYQAGLARGNDPHVFSKPGDSMTDNPDFLLPFAEGRYDLGEYEYLRAVIDQFAGFPARGQGWTLDSFATVSLAAAHGFNIAGPLDSTWADPGWCKGGEAPLACEYRVVRPTLSVIMFGTNDVAYTEPAAYDFYLRTMVIQTLDQDIVPLLNTFPTRPEDPDKSLLLNQIVVKVASDYGIPLINLNRALEPLANHGVNLADTLHLSVPTDGRADHFTEVNLQAGATVRNLVTLQALYELLQAVQ